MIKIQPKFLSKNGKKEFAVLPYEEFVAVQKILEDLEDLEDLLDLRQAKQENGDRASISLEAVKERLGIK